MKILHRFLFLNLWANFYQKYRNKVWRAALLDFSKNLGWNSWNWWDLTNFFFFFFFKGMFGLIFEFLSSRSSPSSHEWQWLASCEKEGWYYAPRMLHAHDACPRSKCDGPRGSCLMHHTCVGAGCAQGASHAHSMLDTCKHEWVGLDCNSKWV